MKKIFIMLSFVILLMGITGCNDDKEVIVDAENYNTDIYKMTLTELKSNASRETKDLVILANKYRDNIEEIKKEANEKLAEIKSQYEMYGYDFNEILKQYNCDNIDDFYNYIFLDYMLNMATEEYTKTLITDEEISEFYNEKVFGKTSVKHILISPSVVTDSTEAEKKVAEEEAIKIANEVISKLKNGEDWDTLAKEYSNAESIISEELEFNYGDLVEEFEEATKKLKDGEYTTSPVKTDYGYHVIYKVSGQNKPSLEEAREDIIKNLISEKMSSDDELKLTAVENIRKETYDYLEDNKIKEILVDTKFYSMYDIEGKSIYGKCKNEKCTKKEYIQLDLNKVNIIEFNKILYKIKTDEIPYSEQNLLSYTYTDDKGQKISFMTQEHLSPTSCSYYATFKTDEKSIIENYDKCSYHIVGNDITINLKVHRMVILKSNPEEFSSETYETRTLNGKISNDFNVLVLNIDNKEYIMSEYNYRQLANYNGEYVLYNKETQKIYDLNGLSLSAYILEGADFKKEQLDLSKYTIIDNYK